MGKAMLTLYDYQQEALKTSDETNTLEYCVLGLVNEAGEVAGVVKKWLRGDYDEATMREKMLGELGDVLWYVAVTADRAGVDVSEWGLEIKGEWLFAPTYKDWLVRLSAKLSVNCSIVADNVTLTGKAPPCLSDDLRTVFTSLKCLANITQLWHFDRVASHNIAKLRDRQERGVIRGSGDER